MAAPRAALVARCGRLPLTVKRARMAVGAGIGIRSSWTAARLPGRCASLQQQVAQLHARAELGVETRIGKSILPGQEAVVLAQAVEQKAFRADLVKEGFITPQRIAGLPKTTIPNPESMATSSRPTETGALLIIATGCAPESANCSSGAC